MKYISFCLVLLAVACAGEVLVSAPVQVAAQVHAPVVIEYKRSPNALRGLSLSGSVVCMIDRGRVVVAPSVGSVLTLNYSYVDSEGIQNGVYQLSNFRSERLPTNSGDEVEFRILADYKDTSGSYGVGTTGFIVIGCYKCKGSMLLVDSSSAVKNQDR